MVAAMSILTTLLSRAAPAAILTGLALSGAAYAQAEHRPALRGDVVVSRDALTLGDLVLHAPASLAETPMFRAPALGQAGTIQAARIVAAAEALGLAPVETGGRVQVAITRAARQVGPAEIEAALRRAMARDLSGDALATGFVFDAAPRLVLPPDLAGEVVASEISYDRRSRRVGATVWIGPSPTERRAQLRVLATVVDLVEVAVLGRALERGESLKPADVTVERRPRESVGSEMIYDGAPLDGRVARRALASGSALRAADLIRPEIVGRGDIVTVVYELPGVSLSLRAKASEAGALGDTIGLVNPQSKKPLQGVVVGPGRVSVNAAPPGPSASAGPLTSAGRLASAAPQP